MIEQIVLNYLNDKMLTPAYMERPKDPPKQYFIIEKTGGGKSEFIKYATITIQSYAETLYEAANLNDVLCEQMEHLIDVPRVMSCSINSNYNYTDTSTKEYRYQAVFNIRML